jgi:hydroxymethylglutaryl-CoA lyase
VTHVTIVEVGSRDGLQAESRLVTPADRVQLIQLLHGAGLSRIEAGSFVSPKAVPQMEGTDVVLRKLAQEGPLDPYMVLVPNMQGMEMALAAQVKQVAFFTAASQTFAQRNINATIEQSLERFQEMIPLAKGAGMHIRGYVSCVMGCPYEGNIDPKVVAQVATSLSALGCDEISLGDTIGVGTPHQMRDLVRLVSQEVPLSQLAIHCHDTYGQAIANIYACLEEGVRIVDSAIAGLGGCPYAPGSSGNVSTEEVVYLLEGLGLSTGVNREKLLATTSYVKDVLGFPVRAACPI